MRKFFDMKDSIASTFGRDLGPKWTKALKEGKFVPIEGEELEKLKTKERKGKAYVFA